MMTTKKSDQIQTGEQIPPGEQIQTDQLAAAASLEAGAADILDPTQAAAADQEQQQVAQGAKAEAELVVTLIAEALQVRWPCLKYPPEQRATVAGKLEPVMVKYGINSEFFARYGVEIDLAMNIAMIGFQSYKLVQEEAAKNSPATNGSGPIQNANG